MRTRFSLLLILVLQACRGGRDSASASRKGEPASAAAEALGAGSAMAHTPERPWDDTIGALVALPSLDGRGAMLFMRDTASAAAVDVELFTHDERTTLASMHSVGSLGCGWAHAATISGAVSDAPMTWSLGLAPGTATALPLDAIADLAPRDSSALAVRVSRLVSALADDSASAPFRDLPVVVRDAWRMQLPDGTPVVIAVAVRSLGTESNPRAEVVTLVAEPENGAPASAWRIAYARRDAGPEDRVEGADLLAAMLLGAKTPLLALVRETDHGPAVDFVARSAPGTWQLRWTTASLPCVE